MTIQAGELENLFEKWILRRPAAHVSVLRRGLMLGLAGAAACLGGQAANAQQCRATFAQANVWTGPGFEKRDVSIEDGRFVERLSKPAQPVPADWMFLIPPFADAHTHELNEPTGPNDPDHRRYLEQGIFYALNPSNVRSGAPNAAPTPTHVDALYAGAALTKPGGHPKPLSEQVARFERMRGIDRGPLPGRAYHEVATAVEARAAVDRVHASGSRVLKLILNNHEGPESTGLTPEVFRAAVEYGVAKGMRPMAHVSSAADFRLAASTKGVAALLHMPGAGPWLPQDEAYLLTAADVALARANGISVVPTIAVAFNSFTEARLERARRLHLHNLKLLRDGGVEISAGADRFGATMLDEMTMLRATGLFSGMQLLNIATTNGLRLLFPDRRIGTFQPGAEASFLVLVMDPRTNWYSLSKAAGGMRGGEIIFDRSGALKRACGLPAPAAAP